MAEEKEKVSLQTNFYRDSFNLVMLIICCTVAAITSLVILAAYIHFDKPVPITFRVENEWRVQKDVPLDDPFLTLPEVLQWVADSLPRAFVYDFTQYDLQLKAASRFFTHDGWKSFLDQLNNFANYNTVQTKKLFVNGTADSAPIKLNEGLLSGRYAWWIQISININYAGLNPPPSKVVTFHVLVVRVPTLNNLKGIGIEKVMVAP